MIPRDHLRSKYDCMYLINGTFYRKIIDVYNETGIPYDTPVKQLNNYRTFKNLSLPSQ